MGSEGVSSRKHHQSKHCETEWGAGVWNTEKQIPSARLSENSYFLKYTFTLAQENTPSKKERERERERKLTTLVLLLSLWQDYPKILKENSQLKGSNNHLPSPQFCLWPGVISVVHFTSYRFHYKEK